jgi:peptidoglycan/LPS O-acetylase OafA/YrhL
MQREPADHRRDIDGLRAVAVLAIVVHHAFPAFVPGGFVGVDIFFVISGFLITRIVAAEMADRRFSFTRFYLRRARRIVPAYVAVTAAVTALAAWLLLPRAFQLFGGSLAASGLFLTNVWFAQGMGYFAPQALQSPLLHLWSLGVEEQFYLVWPLLLAGLAWAPLRRARPILLIVLAAASLAGAQQLIAHNGAVWAFYLFPTRIWEFLSGGALALGLVRSPRSAIVANFAAAAGLGFIAGSLFLVREATPFPGLAAMPSCLGSVLVIWSGLGHAPVTAAPLRWRAIVWVGLISYSLYLWHWPLLVLARVWLQRPLSALEAAITLIVSVGLAALTWRFVEQPFRKAPPQVSRRALALTLAPLLLMIAAGALIFATKGLPMRLAPAARAAAAFSGTDINPARDLCFNRARLARPGCRFGAAADAGDYDVLVWGDSHADAITPGVVAWARTRGLSVREATKGGCPPLVDVRAVAPRRGEIPGCRDAAPFLLKEIAANPNLKVIVLAARWAMYADPTVVYDPDSPPISLQDARSRSTSTYPLGQALSRTLAAIAATHTGARIVIVGPVPELTFSPPDCVAQARHLGRREWACWDAPAALPLIRAQKAEAAIREAVRVHPAARAVFPAGKLCTPASCLTVQRGTLLYFDDDHLSASGARMLVPGWLDEALSPPGSPPAPRPAGQPPPPR